MFCEECGEPVRPGEIGSYKEVIGWVQERRGGGAHGVSDMKPTGKVLHDACWTSRRLDGVQRLF